MIKISKDGIEVDHGRYLSDSSTGLFMYLNILLLSHFKLLGIDLLAKPIFEENITVDILILFIFFLLNTAVGIVISVTSWFFFEFLNTYFFEKLFFKIKFPLNTIQYCSDFDLLCVAHLIQYDNWIRTIILYEEKLMLKNMDLTRYRIQRSTRVLLRNVAFILFIDSILQLLNYQIILAISIFCVCLFFLLLSGALSFFSNVGLLVKYDNYLASCKTDVQYY